MDPNNSGTWLMGFDDLLVDDPSDDDEGDMDVFDEMKTIFFLLNIDRYFKGTSVLISIEDGVLNVNSKNFSVANTYPHNNIGDTPHKLMKGSTAKIYSDLEKYQNNLLAFQNNKHVELFSHIILSKE